MPLFHKLTVTHVRKTIRDAVVVSLAPPEGADFSFVQGQYLTFRREFDGVELRRSYSICVGRGADILQIGIKKVAGGAFSTWANENLMPGMELESMQPMGSFHTPLSPDRPKNYLCFAGGSGITPVLSILNTVLDQEPQARMTLVYANRGVNSIMFREEIEDLKNRFMDRLNVLHVLEDDAQDIELFQGRVDPEKCAALFEHWIDVSQIDTTFICGPEPMMLGIVAALKEHGMREDQIKFELFLSSQPGRLTRPAAADTDPAAKIATTEVTVTLDGATRRFAMPRDLSVLDAARDNTLDAPYACKAGVCSTCKCKVIDGEVEMMANHALEDYEVRAGYILSCQSFPLTDRLVIDYDQH